MCAACRARAATRSSISRPCPGRWPPPGSSTGISNPWAGCGIGPGAHRLLPLNGLRQNEAFRNYADHALTEDFRKEFDELRALAAARPTAIMCAEALWWRCHRRIIADHLLVAGSPVAHVMGDGKIEAAKLTPGAVVAGDGRLVYPAEQRDMGF